MRSAAALLQDGVLANRANEATPPPRRLLAHTHADNRHRVGALIDGAHAVAHVGQALENT